MNRWRRGIIASVAACAAAGAAFLTPTTSGTLSGAITNTTNQAISAITNGPCTSTATGTTSAYLVWPLDDGPAATTAWDSSRNSRPGTYTNTAQITYGVAGPCPKDNARAVTLSGTANGGYVTTAASAAVTGPQVFSAAIWFKTTTTAGGKLIGFGSSQTGSSGSYDRHLYMTTTGKVVAGVYPSTGASGIPNTTRTVTSTASYNDNTWHQAVMTLSSAGLKLYVDGSLLGTDTAAVSAQSFSGYWRVGYDNLSSWPSAPTSFWFAGSVAFASVYTAALDQTQVTALNNAGR